MKESTTKKTSIAVILLSVMTAVALYMDVPDKFRSRVVNTPPADDVASFFNGAVLKWIIPNSPGGGYDEYARLIAPYIEKHSGARVRLSNIPGSGGLRAMSELFNSPADGLTIGLINGSGMITSQIAAISSSDDQMSELSFLGRVVDDTRVLTLSTLSKHMSFDDLLRAGTPLKIGATGFGGSTYVDAVISRDLFGLNMNVIHGFNNSSAMRQAMLSGSIDGAWSSWGSIVDEVASGQIRIVLQGGRTRTASLPDVPTAFEFLDKAVDQERVHDVFGVWVTLHDVGRCVAAPPGLSAEKLQFLREVFRQALNDPRFLDEAANARRTINYASGEEMEHLIATTLTIPVEIQQVFIDSVRSGLQ